MTEVVLDEDWTSGIGGGLWSTGLSMSKYFQKNKDTLKRKLSMSRVLELGSGNGYLAAVLSSIVHDCSVVVTDTAEHCPLITRTFESNSAHIPDWQSRVNVKELIWGKDKDLGIFDFVFGTDVAYRDHLHDPLITALQDHMGENSVALIGEFFFFNKFHLIHLQNQAIPLV